LQLAVSQTPNGIKLAVVGQGSSASGQGIPEPTDAAVVNVATSDKVTMAPRDAPIGAVAKAVTDTAPLKTPLTPLEALAVSAAAQTAATRQGSLAPLFANLELVAVSDALPEKLQQAVAPLLALRPNLDQNLSGDDVKAAFRNSGRFAKHCCRSAAQPSRKTYRPRRLRTNRNGLHKCLPASPQPMRRRSRRSRRPWRPP
jgi:hypothetical protein